MLVGVAAGAATVQASVGGVALDVMTASVRRRAARSDARGAAAVLMPIDVVIRGPVRLGAIGRARSHASGSAARWPKGVGEGVSTTETPADDEWEAAAAPNAHARAATKSVGKHGEAQECRIQCARVERTVVPGARPRPVTPVPWQSPKIAARARAHFYVRQQPRPPGDELGAALAATPPSPIVVIVERRRLARPIGGERHRRRSASMAEGACGSRQECGHRQDDGGRR